MEQNSVWFSEFFSIIASSPVFANWICKAGGRNQELNMRLPPSSRPTSNNITSDLPAVFRAFCASNQTLDWCWITRLTKTTDKSVLPPPLRSFIVKMMSSQALTSISNIQNPQENSGRQSRSVDESRRRSVRVRVTKNSLRADEPERQHTSVEKQRQQKKKSVKPDLEFFSLWSKAGGRIIQNTAGRRVKLNRTQSAFPHFHRRWNARRGRSAPRLVWTFISVFTERCICLFMLG